MNYQTNATTTKNSQENLPTPSSVEQQKMAYAPGLGGFVREPLATAASPAAAPTSTTSMGCDIHTRAHAQDRL